MTVAILWDPAALYVFYRLPPAVAAIVDHAVIALAERGEGQLERPVGRGVFRGPGASRPPATSSLARDARPPLA